MNPWKPLFITCTLGFTTLVHVKELRVLRPVIDEECVWNKTRSQNNILDATKDKYSEAGIGC